EATRPGPAASACWRLDLAARAEVGGAAPRTCLGDDAPAAPARLAVALPHLDLLLEVPGLAVHVDERMALGGGPAVLRRLVEQLDERPVEAPDLHRGQRRDLAIGLEAG